jgi:hypothetical protein
MWKRGCTLGDWVAVSALQAFVDGKLVDGAAF